MGVEERHSHASEGVRKGGQEPQEVGVVSKRLVDIAMNRGIVWALWAGQGLD